MKKNFSFDLDKIMDQLAEEGEDGEWASSRFQSKVDECVSNTQQVNSRKVSEATHADADGVIGIGQAEHERTVVNPN